MQERTAAGVKWEKDEKLRQGTEGFCFIQLQFLHFDD